MVNEKIAGPDLKEIADEVRKLNILLQDPQPGLATWQATSQEQGRKVKKLLIKALPEDDQS